jgi:hypothetical protein
VSSVIGGPGTFTPGTPISNSGFAIGLFVGAVVGAVIYNAMAGIGPATAIIMGAIVTVGALALAINLLSGFTLKGEPA